MDTTGKRSGIGANWSAHRVDAWEKKNGPICPSNRLNRGGGEPSGHALRCLQQ